MPLYEYLCDACGWTTEVIQAFSDPPVTHCERCGGKVKKLLSPPAVQFKGSGWYVTDYARASAKRTEKPAEAEGGKAHDAGAEAKPSPAPKKEPAPS